jgi:hypothetical protein
VFDHVETTSQIYICYDRYNEEPINLANGQYELMLSARAKPRTHHIGTMVITMIDGNINVGMKSRDHLGG